MTFSLVTSSMVVPLTLVDLLTLLLSVTP